MPQLYVPRAFAETRIEVLTEFVRAHGFGTLITARGDEPRASHLPFVLEEEAGRSVLYAHVARGNEHWREGDGPALAIFAGPHHYISPTWYAEAGTVPTWNYVTVHARGRLEWLDSLDARRRVLEKTIELYERGNAAPWRADFDAEYVKAEMQHIFPLRIVVDAFEGKWKLNQHHPVARRERTIAALRAAGGEDALAIAELMERTLPPR